MYAVARNRYTVGTARISALGTPKWQKSHFGVLGAEIRYSVGHYCITSTKWSRIPMISSFTLAW